MNDATQAAYAWGWQTIPIGASLALLLSASVYLCGWLRLGETRPEQIPGWRAVCFLLGLFSVWIAIASPLDLLSGALLTAHMIQHLLLMAVAPPLIVLGAPTVPMLRGLPRFFVREGLGPFFTLAPVHALQRLFGSRVFAWLLMNVVFLLWHAPAMYDLALRSPGWHEVEHFCFLSTSVLFWWHIVAPWPTVYRASRWLLLPFLLTADFVNTGLSAFLSFSGRVAYPAYSSVPRFFGLSVLDDQVAAGSLMWVVGSVFFLGAAMLITVQLLSHKAERRKRALEGGRARLQALHEAQRAAGEPGPGVLQRLRSRWSGSRGAARAKGDEQRGDRHSGLDLLRVRGVGGLLRSRYGRQSLQAVSLLVATAVIVDGLFGHQMGSMNLAGIVPWTYARGLFVLALLVCGNLFCMSCPFTLPRELAKWVLRRLGMQQMIWPRALRNKWLPVGLVAVFFWAYEAFDLWNSPARTAAIVLAYFVTAFAVDAVFRDASFCKYVCPLGQFNFVSSLLSPVEVAPRSLETCGGCETRDCIAGHGDARTGVGYQRGCELHLFLPEKQGNMDCTLCMDCVKACPHDNVGLFAQAPALQLVQLSVADPQRSAVGRYRQRLDIGVLAATVIAAAFASAAVMVTPVADRLDRLSAGMAPLLSNTAGLGLAVLCPALLLGLLLLAVTTMRPAGRAPLLQELPQWVLALLPIGLGMWAAHLSFHLLTAWSSLWPGLLQAAHDLLRMNFARPDWMAEKPLLTASALLQVQMGILDAGLLGTLYLGWRLAGRVAELRQGVVAGSAAAVPLGVVERARLLLPWSTIAVLLYAAGMWILLQPMQMRGMAGM